MSPVVLDQPHATRGARLWLECLLYSLSSPSLSPAHPLPSCPTPLDSSLLELLEYFGVYLYGIHSELLSDPLVKAVSCEMFECVCVCVYVCVFVYVHV